MRETRKEKTVKELAIALFVLSLIGTLLFGSLDIAFLSEMLTVETGVFEQNGALSPEMEILSLIIFLVAALGMIIYALIFLLKKNYKRALGSECILLLVFLFQIIFWTQTTLAGP